jgi:choline-sulfatase
MRKPNILLVMADQLTAGVLPAYGNKVAKTPHIDALCAQGTVFDNTYCNFPICAPSRASMLTGRRATQVGAFDNGADFPSSTPTLMHHLRLEGYRTILAGKMHFVGPDQLHGYEERVTTDIYPSDFTWTPDWQRPGPPVSGARMSLLGVVEAGLCERSLQIDYDEEVAYAAERKLFDLARDQDKRPFFMTVSFTHPHNPFVTTREYWDRYDPAEIDMPAVGPIPFEKQDGRSRRHYLLTRCDEHDITRDRLRNARHAYYAMTSYIDDKLGSLMRTLKAAGLAEDTVVIFTSDHGEMLGERGMWFKMCLFEGSVRVPMVIAGPGWPKGATRAENTSLLDLAPTILAQAAGAPRETTFEGRDLLPLAKGEASDWPQDVWCEYTAEGCDEPWLMLRRGSRKMIWSETHGPQLFDLAADPHEARDLASVPEHADEVATMIAAIRAHWDVPALHSAVLASQKRRHMLRAALAEGRRPAWDWQPVNDAAKQYVRSGDSPTLTKIRSRLPYFPPVPLDHPRKTEDTP